VDCDSFDAGSGPWWILLNMIMNYRLHTRLGISLLPLKLNVARILRHGVSIALSVSSCTKMGMCSTLAVHLITAYVLLLFLQSTTLEMPTLCRRSLVLPHVRFPLTFIMLAFHMAGFHFILFVKTCTWAVRPSDVSLCDLTTLSVLVEACK
jgi:hypothetical protein